MENRSQPLKAQFVRHIVPAVVAQMVFALYTMVDGVMVARGVNETALAAVNLSLPYVNLIFAISLTFAVGASISVSVFLGKNQKDAADEAYTQHLIVICGLSVVIVIGTLVFAAPIARALGGAGDTLRMVQTYVGVIAAFCPCSMIAYYFEIMIKTDGKPQLATALVVMGTLLNLALDYLLVFIIPLGIFGAALATGLSQFGVMLGFSCYFLFFRKSALRLVRVRLRLREVWKTVRLGFSSGIADYSAGLMIFFYNHAILRFFGTDGIVGYTIAAYWNTIVTMSLTGIAQGSQPLVSFAHGQRDTARCRTLLRCGLAAALLLSAAVSLPAWFAAKGIVGVFIAPENVFLRETSVQILRRMSLAFLPAGIAIVIGGWMASQERNRAATAISILRGIVLPVGALWGVTALAGGSGIWWVPVITELMCAAIAVCLYVRVQKKRGD